MEIKINTENPIPLANPLVLAPEFLKINTHATVLPTRQAKIFDLVNENDPILHQPTTPFDFKNPPIDPLYLATSMFETMFKNKGIGLTANQVGIPYAVVTVGSDNSNKQIFFNPKIIEQSANLKSDMEGCLSFPLLFLKVDRPEWVTVEYQYITGETRQTTYTGVTARIVAHEIDHCNGKTFIDRVGKTSLLIAKEKRVKLRKKIGRRKP